MNWLANMIEIIKVETKNVKVGKRYYSFDYKIWRGKKLINEGIDSGSHTRHPSTIRKALLTGYATELIIQRYL